MDPIKVILHGGLIVYVEFGYVHYQPPDYKVIEGKYHRLVVTDITSCTISRAIAGGNLTHDYVGTAYCSIKDDYNWMTGNREALRRAAESMWYAMPDVEMDFPSFAAQFARQVMPKLAMRVQAKRQPTTAARYRKLRQAVQDVLHYMEGTSDSVDRLVVTDIFAAAGVLRERHEVVHK